MQALKTQMPKTGRKTLNTRSVHGDDDMDKWFGATDCHMYKH